MDYDDLSKKIKQLKVEDYIWIIYIGIIFMSWFSNDLERKYFLYNDINSRDKYRKIMIFIFIILTIIYIYFLKDSLDDVMKLKSTDSGRVKELTILSFVGSLLIVISGLIFLYIVVMDKELNVEIAFN